MIKIDNERELLPVLRNPLANWDDVKSLIFPVFSGFLHSENDYDEYPGWAFLMRFIKNTDVRYQQGVAAMDMSRAKEMDGWTIAPSKKDRNDSIWQYNNAVMIIHMNSWLWFE